MIRDATDGDVEAIAHVHVAAWRETYQGIMPVEILDQLDEGRRATQWRGGFDVASIRSTAVKLHGPRLAERVA